MRLSVPSRQAGFLWRLSYRPDSFLQGLIIYFLIISCAAVTIRTLTGEYYFADWSEAVINAALCLFCLLSGGNLFGGFSNENRRKRS
ncbi:MAG: hypothetical protein CPSOU_4943 [uncultured Paraburkholderia sp.]|nr:MAG: hypothetical protein CPSOU_4943 [uncultured Paraburkholderia sp.]